MKSTLRIVGTCYSGISLTPKQQCLIAQDAVTQQLYVISIAVSHSPRPVGLHELVGAYSSVVIQTAGYEVKTHD